MYKLIETLYCKSQKCLDKQFSFSPFRYNFQVYKTPMKLQKFTWNLVINKFWKFNCDKKQKKNNKTYLPVCSIPIQQGSAVN